MKGERLTARRVIHRHAAAASAVKVDVGALRHANVAAVASAEEEGRRPVVGEVFRKGARCAGCLLANVVPSWVHGDVEHVAAHNLVDMGRLRGARENKTVNRTASVGIARIV